MKKKWIILITAAVAVVLALTGVLIWLNYLKNRPGAHLVGGELYAKFNGVGFVIDAETGKLTEEESPVYVDGHSEKGVFEGHLELLGFPITEVGTIKGDAVVQELSNGFYSIYYAPSCTHVNEEDYESGPRQETHFTTYEYTYYVYPEAPDFLIVGIYEWMELDGDPRYVVLADNAEEAMEKYQWFIANEPK